MCKKGNDEQQIDQQSSQESVWDREPLESTRIEKEDKGEGDLYREK